MLVALKRYRRKKSRGKVISSRIINFFIFEIIYSIYSTNCINLRGEKERRIKHDEITRKKCSEIHKVLCLMCHKIVIK